MKYSLLSETDNLYLNEQIFNKIKTLHLEQETPDLNPEQSILDKYYKNFVRSGANLNEADKQTLRDINKELKQAELKFGENLLAENNAYQRFVAIRLNLRFARECNFCCFRSRKGCRTT